MEQPIRIYVDGVALPGKVRSLGDEDPLGVYRTALVSPSTLPIQIGIGHPGYPLKGAVDDVRIYSKALSAVEVANLAAKFGF